MNRYSKLVLSIFLFIFSVAPVANSKIVSSVAIKTSKDAEQTSRNSWAEKMKSILPLKLCETNSFLRSCYRVNQATCEQTVHLSMENCIANTRTPSSIDIKKMEPQLNFQLGVCVAKDFKKKNEHFFINDSFCNGGVK